MNLIITLTATRPDKTVDFWYNLNHTNLTNDAPALTQAMDSRGIQQSIVTSEDGLTLTNTFSNLTETTWAEFMGVVFSLTESLAARNTYFLTNNHTLTLKKVDVDTNAVVEEIPDVIAYTS